MCIKLNVTPSVLAIYNVVYLLLPCECDDYLFKGNDVILVNCTHVTVCLNFYKNKIYPSPLPVLQIHLCTQMFVL